MFGCFQANLNELRSLGRTYDNYDHIDKILKSPSRKWRPRVTILGVLKNLESMSLEELIGTLKVHEQELQQDKGLRREKSMALSSRKNKKESSSREQIQKSSSETLKVNDSSDDEYEEDSDEDEITFIPRKICMMWRNKSGSKWRSSTRRMPRDKKDKKNM